MQKTEESLLLNSHDAPTEVPMFTVKSQILTREEKNMVRRALFYYQKECYEKHGELPKHVINLLGNVADKLNLRHPTD